MARIWIACAVGMLAIATPSMGRAQGGPEAPPDDFKGGGGTPPPVAPVTPAKQPNTPPPPPRSYSGAYYPGQQPAAMPRSRGYHLHDTFYLRMALGIGYLSVKTKFDTSPDSTTTTGAGLGLDLLLGGTPIPGLVIGGGLAGTGTSSPRIKQGAREYDGSYSVTSVLLGPFVDWFPDAEGGWHLGAMLGIAGLQTATVSNSEKQSAQGGGGALFGGYDAWVSDNWSLGGMLRLSASRTQKTIGNLSETDDIVSVTVLFTGLYH